MFKNYKKIGKIMVEKIVKNHNYEIYGQPVPSSNQKNIFIL